MKFLNYILVLFSVFVVSNFGFGQNIPMTNTSVSLCTGTLLDPGGTGNYGNNSNVTMTICPTTPGSMLQVSFSSFVTEDAWDFLNIYNGNTTGAPLMTSATGTDAAFTIIANNPTGCLTFVFTSDGSTTAAGFVGAISCMAPCQTVIAALTANPAVSAGTIDICPGTQVNFTGNPSFPQNNTGYNQTAASSTYAWSFGALQGTATGLNTSHVFANPGIYDIDLTVTDNNGCFNTNDVNIQVRVSDDPDFTGTAATQSVICLGQTNTLQGVVAPTEIAMACTPPVAGTTFLPDGSGVSYVSATTVDCFNAAQTITSGNQIVDICLDIEHSYLGDLSITIICPNGQSTDLLVYSALDNTNGQFLGNALDDATTNPGTGLTYCFNTSGTQTMNAAAGAVLGGSIMPSGNYLPVGSYNSLIGCPMNGDWTIEVTDNLASDNGYIFGWNIDFDPALVPGTSTYTPAITSQSWNADPTITATSGNQITVQPTVAGPACYTYEATDEFNCVYSETVCFTVLPANDPACASTCLITNMFASIGACEPDNTFDVTGDFTYSNNPGTGTVVVEVTNGSGTQTQIFNPPFVDGTSYNFDIQGNTADGSAVTVTIYFSDDLSCTADITSTSPNDCVCSADIGTFTAGITGVSTNDYVLCFGDQLNLASNNDGTDPQEATNPPGPVYDPGIAYVAYECPPTIFPQNDFTLDPCVLGIVSFNQMFNSTNSLGQPPYAGTFTNNTIYYVPITVYSITDGYYSYTNTSENCYDMGEIFTVQYLPQITFTQVQDCQAGTVTATLNGGQPSVDGTSFSVVPGSLTPATASFGNTTAPLGGTITINGLVNGNAYSFQVQDANGCPRTITGTFTGVTSSSFTYPQSAYCKNAANPSPIISGVGGGVFSSTAGLSINATSGVINMAASTAGTYTVTYTSPGAPCNSSSTFVITINPLPVIVVPNASMCLNGSAVLTASGAITYVWSPGATLSATTGTSVTATPAATTVYTITGTTTATGCVGTTTATVTVNPLPTIGGTLSVCVGNTRQLTGSATANATNPWVSSNTTVATINSTGLVTGLVAGTTNITYTNSNGCQVTQVFTVFPIPTVVANDVSVCTTGTVNITASGANTYTWSPGTSLSATTGSSVTFTPGTTTTYTVTGTDVNGCTNTDPVTVTVLANAPIVASADVTICNGAMTNISASGGVSYTWNQGLGAGQNFNVSPTTTTTYTVTGTDASGCVGTDQVIVTVNPLPTATISGTASVCQNGTSPVVTFNGAGGTAPYTFTYTINGGGNATVVSNGAGVATVNAPTGTVGTFTYNLVSVQDASSTTCSQTQAGSAIITVNPLPTATISGTASVCQNGTSPVITFNGASGTAPYTFTYNINGGGNTTVVSNAAGVATVNAPTGTVGTFTYNLVSVQDASSTSCTQAQTGSAIITVNPLPTATISGTASVCLGGTSPVITFTGVNGTSPYTFTYNINGAGQTTVTSVGNTATVSAPSTPVGTFNYNLVSVVDASSTACTQNQTGTATITVNPNPVPVITGATEYCAGNTATISTTVPYTTYAWSTGGSTPSIQVTDADNPITVTVTNANGCSGTSGTYSVVQNNVITYNTQVEICQGGSATIHGTNQTTAGVYSQTFVLGTGCDSTSNVTLIVNPLPVINAGVNQTVCDGVQVTLNATGAPAIVWSPLVTNGVPFTQAVGTVTYTAEGTDANGCVNTDAVDVTVLPLPVMNAVPDQVLCNNSATNAVVFSSTPAGTYSWINDNTSIGLAANGNSTIASFNATNGGAAPSVATITVTPTANGCVGTPDQFTITVNQSPTASIAGTASVCLNGTSPTVTFTGSNSIAPYTFNYTLNGTPNSIVSTGNTAVITAPTNVAGTFTYSLVSVTDASTTTCSNTAVGTATITVNALPVVSAGTDVVACLNDNITLTGTGAVSYSWSPLVTNGVAFTPSVGSQNYTVTGTDGNGCVNTDIVNVLVNPLPVIVAGPDVVICIGDQVTLTGQGGGVGAIYNWTSPVIDNTPFSPLATATYTVTGTDGNGCQNTDNVIVTVQPLPAISAGNNLNGCENDDFILTGSGGGAGTTYTWDNGVVNGQSFVSPVGTTTYIVTGTDIYGCQNTDQTDILVEQAPLVSFDYDQVGNCAPVTVTFTNTSVPVGVNCIWNFDDGSVVNGCGPIVHTFTTAGAYGASLQTETALSGCVGSVYYADIITVEANPIASFTADPTVTTTINTEVHFTNTSIGATFYEWNFGDTSPLSNVVNPIHEYNSEEAGSYYVTLIATTPGGCADTAHLLIKIDEELIFYVPNTFTPDQDEYNEVFQPIFTSGYDPYAFSMWIFNRWGEVVFETHDDKIGWDGTYGVDGNDCQDGTYTWKISFKTKKNDERKVIHGHVNLLR